jgi:hypothetical protein
VSPFPPTTFRTSDGGILLLSSDIQKKNILLLRLKRSEWMPENRTDLVQGTLDVLILKTLALQPMHGYGIAVRVEQTSGDVFA